LPPLGNRCSGRWPEDGRPPCSDCGPVRIPKLPCKLSKLALPKKTLLSSAFRAVVSVFFLSFFLSIFRVFLSRLPAPPRQPYPSNYPARARTHNILVIYATKRTEVPNTTPECRCDGMLEFRYAAFQCENFSLSHNAAFAGAAATAENGTAGRPIEVPTTHQKSSDRNNRWFIRRYCRRRPQYY